MPSTQAGVHDARNPGETELGFAALGFRLPGVCDAAPHLRKPSPCGLLQLADAYRAEEIVFAGDTRDDAQTRAARAQDPQEDVRSSFKGLAHGKRGPGRRPSGLMAAGSATLRHARRP